MSQVVVCLLVGARHWGAGVQESISLARLSPTSRALPFTGARYDAGNGLGQLRSAVAALESATSEEPAAGLDGIRPV